MSTPRRYLSKVRDGAARETRRRILGVAEEELHRVGYHAMSIAELARRAEVSPQTIYNSVGGKAAVIKALYDVRLAGDDERISISQRPEFTQILAQPDRASTLRAYVAAGRLLYARVGELLGVLLVDGPGPDAALRGFLATIERERRTGNAAVVRHLEERFGLPTGWPFEPCVDVVWTATAYEVADRLVRRCGWSLDAYERFVGDLLVTTFEGPPP